MSAEDTRWRRIPDGAGGAAGDTVGREGPADMTHRRSASTVDEGCAHVPEGCRREELRGQQSARAREEDEMEADIIGVVQRGLRIGRCRIVGPRICRQRPDTHNGMLT